MNHRRITSLVICSLALSGTAITARADDQSPAPIITSVCGLAKEPARFDGQLVQVRAVVKSGFEFFGIVSDGKDESCPEFISLTVPSDTQGLVDDHGAIIDDYAYINSMADLEHPEKLKWKAARRPWNKVAPGEAQLKLYELVSQYYPGAPDVLCLPQYCPKYKITATLLGVFDHREPGRMRAVRNSSTGTISATTMSFGHLGRAPSQLAIVGVLDLVAVPIERSAYLKKK